jgi:hypothetical protein
MLRIRDSAKPLVGGLNSGVWTPAGGYQRPVVHYPEWRQQTGGMAVGWLDPKTDPYSPDPPPTGKP